MGRLDNRSMDVLMVNTVVGAGGAAGVALDLALEIRQRGHRCRIVTGMQLKPVDDVIVMPAGYPRLRKVIDKIVKQWSGQPWTAAVCRRLARFSEYSEWPTPPNGPYDYIGPTGSWRILDTAPNLPDIVHTHNLHGGYFDLRALPAISAKVPVVMTLHDAWMLAGHCAHSFDCARWLSGCGECPDLAIPVEVPVDRTAENWQQKASIYRKSRYRVATPARWLMDKVERSMLRAGMIEGRVIPNGVNLKVFCPGDRRAERRALGLPDDAIIVLFVAYGIRQNIWKDYDLLEKAIARLSIPSERNVIFIALGEDGPTQAIGSTEIRFVPFVARAEVLAAYYRAADLYVHPARAETFPLVVLEALASGTPVVATAVGGISEQVISLDAPGADPTVRTSPSRTATGILTPPGDPIAFAAAIQHLCGDAAILAELSENAARDARLRFGLERQADAYLEWFDEIRANWAHERWTNRIATWAPRRFARRVRGRLPLR